MTVLGKLLLWVRQAKEKHSLVESQTPPGAKRARPAGWCTVLNGGDGRYYRTLETRDLPAAIRVAAVFAQHVPDSALVAAATVSHLPVVGPAKVAAVLSLPRGGAYELMMRRFGVN